MSLMLSASLAGTGAGAAVPVLAAEVENTVDIGSDAEQGVQPLAEEEPGDSGSAGGDVSDGGAGSGGDVSDGGAGSGGDVSDGGAGSGGDVSDGGSGSGGDAGDGGAGSSGDTDDGGSGSGSDAGGGSTGSGSENGGSTEIEKKPQTEKETEKKPQTEKETEKKPQTEKETEKKKQTEKETEKKTQTEKETEKKTQTEKETDKNAETEKQPQTVIVVGPGSETETAAKSETEIVIEVKQPEENPLYAEYLGTGEGWEQLGIVWNGESTAADYDLLVAGNTVIICTQGDTIEMSDGEQEIAADRSLILSGAQLARLLNEKEKKQLVFEMDSVMLVLDIEDLLGGSLSKLMTLALSGEEEITEETLKLDFDAMEETVLTEEQLTAVEIEIRLKPVVSVDGRNGYDISVWMLWDKQELEVSQLIPSLSVALEADGLFEEEEKTEFAMNHAVEWTDNSGTVTMRASALVSMPGALIGMSEDTADRFTVLMAEDTEIPTTEFVEADTLEKHQHTVLMASYAGPGVYRIS